MNVLGVGLPGAILVGALAYATPARSAQYSLRVTRDVSSGGLHDSIRSSAAGQRSISAYQGGWFTVASG